MPVGTACCSQFQWSHHACSHVVPSWSLWRRGGWDKLDSGTAWTQGIMSTRHWEETNSPFRQKPLWPICSIFAVIEPILFLDKRNQQKASSSHAAVCVVETVILPCLHRDVLMVSALRLECILMNCSVDWRSCIKTVQAASTVRAACAPVLLQQPFGHIAESAWEQNIVFWGHFPWLE